MKHQVNEDHKTALKLKFGPFVLSFLFSMLGYFLLEDKVLGYFLGKTVGFSVAFIVFIKKLRFQAFVIEKEILIDFLHRIKKLVIIYLT